MYFLCTFMGNIQVENMLCLKVIDEDKNTAMYIGDLLRITNTANHDKLLKKFNYMRTNAKRIISLIKFIKTVSKNDIIYNLDTIALRVENKLQFICHLDEFEKYMNEFLS